MTTTKIIVCTALIFLLGLTALIVADADVISILPLLYLGVVSLSAYAIYDKHDLSLSYFYPSSIMVLYVSVFFFMGSLAFKYELVLMWAASQSEYYYFTNIGMISFYFICAICVTLLSQVLSRKRSTYSTFYATAAKPTERYPCINIGECLLSVLVIALSLAVDIPLPGGTGSFSSTFFMFAIIHISYLVKSANRNYRYIIYVVLGGLTAIFFYEDRRLLFYFGFILCFIEVFDKCPYRIRARNVVLFSLIAASLIATNIAMSIQRGVGGFGSKSLADAFQYVDDYLASDWAKTMLFHNFEGPPAMFHSYNAVNYMLQSGAYRHGSTVLKVLFLPIPRDYFPGKPRSMVDEYTALFYPAYRAEGGSYVPNFYAEAFWNFGFVGGLGFLGFIFYWFDTIYYKWMMRMRHEVTMENVFFLSSFALLLFLYRGSGFDLYGLFVGIFYVMAFAYKWCSGMRQAPGSTRLTINAKHARH